MHLHSRGTGYPVLFIHGLPTSSQLWAGTIDKLHDQFTCIAVDLPGLGKSPREGGGLEQLGPLAEKIEQIRVEQKIEKWHVVGHDAGSAIAVHYAHRYQEHVGCLALLSPAVFPDLKPYHLFRLLRRPVLGELLAPLINVLLWNIVMRYAVGPNRAGSRSAVDDFHAPFSGPWGAWRLMALLRWGNPAVVLASLPAMLPQLLVPTLIFQGLRDRAVPARFARQASALIPRSRIVMVDSGHFIPLNNPAVVAMELQRFFESAAVA